MEACLSEDKTHSCYVSACRILSVFIPSFIIPNFSEVVVCRLVYFWRELKIEPILVQNMQNKNQYAASVPEISVLKDPNWSHDPQIEKLCECEQNRNLFCC